MKFNEILVKNRDFLEKLLLVGMSIGIFGQFLSIAFISSEAALPRSLIRTFDNDAETGVVVAQSTRIWNDNHWRAYGPINYRMERLLERFTHAPASDKYTEKENRERVTHFQFQMVNLLSLYAISFLIAVALFKDWVLRLLVLQVLPTLILTDITWVRLLQRPHPDYIFSLFLGVYALFGLRYILVRGRVAAKGGETRLGVVSGNQEQEPEPEPKKKLAAPPGSLGIRERVGLFFVEAFHEFRAALKSDEFQPLVLASVAFGLAAATKMTVLLAATSVLILVLAPTFMKTLARALFFFKFSVLTYFVVGFPQSLAVLGVLQFLRKQSKNSSAPDMESTMNWLNLYKSQLLLPLGFVILVGILIPKSEKELVSLRKSAAAILIAILFCLAPTVMLFLRKIEAPFDWYPMPFVVMLWVLGAWLTMFLNVSHFGPWFSRQWQNLRMSPWFVIALMFVGPWLSPAQPLTLRREIEQRQICFDRLNELKNKTHAFIKEGRHVILGAHAPVDDALLVRGKNGKRSNFEINFFPGLDLFIPGETVWFVENTGHMHNAMPPEMGGNLTGWVREERIHKAIEFYSLFYKKSETVDPYGRKWRKVFNECGFEAWQAE